MIEFILLFVIIVSLFLFSCIIFSCDLLSPSIITTFVFLISGIGVLYNAEKWRISYSFQTVLIITLGLLTVIISELVAKKAFYKTKFIKTTNLSKINILFPIQLVIYFFDFIMLSIFCVKIFQLGISIGVSGLFAIGAVKDSSEVAVSGIPLIAYDFCYYIGFVFIYIFCRNTFLVKEKLRKNLPYLVPVIIGLIAVIFRGARGPLLQYLVAFFFLSVLFSRKNRKKHIKNRFKFILKWGICIFLFTVCFYFLREIVKGRSNSTTFIDYITYYVGSPLYLFDKVVQNQQDVYSGYNYFGATTFTNFYGTLYQIGVLNENVSGLNFTTVKTINGTMSGNEYTFFMRPYYDFGILGMSIFVFIYFFIFNYIYYKKIKYKFFAEKNQYIIISYSMFFYQIVMSFYYCFNAQDFRPQTLILIFFVFAFYKFIKCLQIKRRT